MDLAGKMYCTVMRQKREQGKYSRVIYLEPVLTTVGQAEDEKVVNTSSSSVGFNICCSVLDQIINDNRLKPSIQPRDHKAQRQPRNDANTQKTGHSSQMIRHCQTKFWR